MTRPTPLSQIVADDLFIDQVAGRQPAGDDPIAGLLAALAEHADRPLGRAPTGRRFRAHRALSTLAAFAIGVSGASVAAAVTVPDGPPTAAPALVAPAREAVGSAPGAGLVQDATGRVMVVGADGTPVDSAWLPESVGPVLVTPTGGPGRASVAEVSRYRWEAVDGFPALGLAGSEQAPNHPDPDAVDPTTSDEPAVEAGAGAADAATTPSDPAATPVDPTAAEPSDAASTDAPPSEDAVAPSAAQDETDDPSTMSDETGPSDASTPTEAGAPSDQGTPTSGGTPTETPGADHPAGKANPSTSHDPKPHPSHPVPPQAPVPAGATEVPAPPAESAPVEAAGTVAAPLTPVMVPLPTIPLAVLPDVSVE